ncbi:MULTISPECIES: sugar ABC transporter permease [unclassified Streptomyces]|uniref:carbohydrate ABC transporter permease n=1 Tax=unclassified Streptomyces TaxID=2593676 RepID=UPI003408E764
MSVRKTGAAAGARGRTRSGRTRSERTRSERTRRGLSDRQLGTLMLLPALALLLCFAVYPFLASVVDSFFRIDFLTRQREFLGLGNYRRLWEDPATRAAFGRSVLWVAGNVVIQAGVGVAVALVLNAGLRGQTLARGLVLFPYVVPAVVAAIVFRFMFNDTTGLVGYLLRASGASDQPVNPFGDPDTVMLALIAVNCWKYVPFIVIVVLARLQTVPRELYEAASLDGAGRMASFRHVTLPWIAPALIVAMLMRTIWTAYDFDLPYLLAQGGPLDSSTTVPLAIRKIAFSDQELGLASALAVSVAILLVVGAWLYLRAYRRTERATG